MSARLPEGASPKSVFMSAGHGRLCPIRAGDHARSGLLYQPKRLRRSTIAVVLLKLYAVGARASWDLHASVTMPRDEVIDAVAFGHGQPSRIAFILARQFQGNPVSRGGLSTRHIDPS